MFRFHIRYFLLFSVLFVTEVLIALYVHDNFIRPYFGDYLVVFLIYFFVRTFISASKTKVIIGVLLFAYLIEVLQYLHIVDRLGLSNNILARTVIGYGFSWWDMLAYTLAAVTIYIADRTE